MGKIHLLPEHVANKIAAGEVVERPASVVKELLENSLDAAATRIRVQVEAGGKKLIQVVDNGCGMLRDDALLAFERHATSKIKLAEDLLSVATLGFRGEALPSIASVSRLRLETRASEDPAGSIVEINGGKIFNVAETGVPPGTSISVRDLFFNTPGRKKFLKSESTELSHIASLVTHYALAHPDRHFELHSASHAVLIAPPVADHRERVYQIFGKEVLDQLIPLRAVQPLDHAGLPSERATLEGKYTDQRSREQELESDRDFGEIRLHGFVSKPELQKLNRNSIFVFVNRRLIRDRLIQHALTEAYRNIIPPAVFPVVLLFLDVPAGEVDVNVHPSKSEVRFRQQTITHDLVRDSVRTALLKARPVPQFLTEISARPSANPSLTPGARASMVDIASWRALYAPALPSGFSLQPPLVPPATERLPFGAESITVEANAALAVARARERIPAADGCISQFANEPDTVTELRATLSSLKPLGQIRESFILAVNEDGLWIIDQHVAHERVLFENILKQRARHNVESQRLLVPLVLELLPAQQVVFAEISQELVSNGFEAEPFGARSVVIKFAPAGIEAAQIERMLQELLDQFCREEQALNLEKVRARIAASIACHAAIKINMPLEQNKMEWLLRELSRTECPISCPHGRPVILRYSLKDIQKAFKRI
jgi:DNA mismatch repair protein MutL